MAGTTPSSISYHFGSQERLIIATAERVYKRLNAERLSMLNAAAQKRHQTRRRLEDVIAALVGPSVRWSLEPAPNTASCRIFHLDVHSAVRIPAPTAP